MAINLERNEPPVKQVVPSNSEHGMLSRMWHTFLTEHKVYPGLKNRIDRVRLRRAGEVTPDEMKKLNTLPTLAYASEMTFKSFLYLYKELLRGSRLQIGFILIGKDVQYEVQDEIILQSVDYKEGHEILCKFWNKLLACNNLKKDLRYFIKLSKFRDKSKMSKERVDRIANMYKHIYAKSMSFKIFILLCTELLRCEKLIFTVVLRDAMEKPFVSTIEIQLLDTAHEMEGEDENGIAFGD